MYTELLSGMHEDPKQHIKSIFTEKYDEVVLLRDIPFYSICEHHLMPFIGTAAVAYLPSGTVLGVSKLARIVDCFTRRLQIQEELTAGIVRVMDSCLQPRGVAVVVEAEHLCMTIRGVKKPGSLVVTTEARGTFRQPARQALALASLTG